MLQDVYCIVLMIRGGSVCVCGGGGGGGGWLSVSL